MGKTELPTRQVLLEERTGVIDVNALLEEYRNPSTTPERKTHIRAQITALGNMLDATASLFQF